MNSFFVMLGIESWKHVLSALVLPPVPLLLLILIGAWQAARQRRFGTSLVVAGVALTWASCCSGTGYWMSRWLLDPPPALSAARIEELRSTTQPKTAIVVLGGGTESFAPEYGASNLTATSSERLRYGLWLARAARLPVAFSGGVGWAQEGTQTEGEVAARIAKQEYGLALRWTEAQSRDTRENAAHSIILMREAGIERLVIVTHDWHMPRALRAFRRAADGRFVIEAAPMGLADRARLPQLAWLPSNEGYKHVRYVLHEWFGLLMGA